MCLSLTRSLGGFRGFLYCLGIGAHPIFSEPEIDCSVMAITAAEALPGVHFVTPEMEGSMRGEMINEYEKLNSEDQKFVGGFGPILLSERY